MKIFSSYKSAKLFKDYFNSLSEEGTSRTAFVEEIKKALDKKLYSDEVLTEYYLTEKEVLEVISNFKS